MSIPSTIRRVRDAQRQGGVPEVWRGVGRVTSRAFGRLSKTPRQSPNLKAWIAHMQGLVKRDILGAFPPLGKDSPRALFWTPMAPWPEMLIEFLVATALRLRGWEVRFALCDGRLPHCEMEHAMSSRPSCDYCWVRSNGILSAFHLPFDRLSQHVSPKEVSQAMAEVEALGYKELASLVVDGYDVGRFSNQYLAAYFRGAVQTVGSDELAVLRRVLAGNLLAFRYASRLSERYAPDVVVTQDGNLCQTQPAYDFFHRKGTRVITWEESPPHQDSFIFSQEEPCVFGKVPRQAWEQVRAQALSDRQADAVEQFLSGWAGGRFGDIRYHPSPETSAPALRQRLRIAPGMRLFVAFTNVVWDSAVVGRDAGFRDMMDWVHTLIDWFSGHPDAGQLLVRVHPAEVRLPKEYRTVMGVAQSVRQRYPNGLPANVILVDAADGAYSYTLAEMANGVGVYTSTLGYELAARGRRVWVSGEAHYRDRGFTLDVENAAHLSSLLATRPWDDRLRPDEIDLARRYVHLRFLRQVVRIPFLKRTQGAYTSRPLFDDLRFLLTGRDPLMSALADRVIDGGPIIDIPQETTAKWSDGPL